MNNWITDRKPDDSYDVIVWADGRCGVGSYIPILDRWIVQIGTTWSMSEVEAWMPFPEGPGAGMGEEIIRAVFDIDLPGGKDD